MNETVRKYTREFILHECDRYTKVVLFISGDSGGNQRHASSGGGLLVDLDRVLAAAFYSTVLTSAKP